MPRIACQVERGIIARMRIYAAKATLQVVRGMQKALQWRAFIHFHRSKTCVLFNSCSQKSETENLYLYSPASQSDLHQRLASPPQ